MFETVLLAACGEDEAGGRGEECCCAQQGCFRALVRLKRGKGGLPSPNFHFHGQKASCSELECISPSDVVMQILGGLPELDVVLLF